MRPLVVHAVWALFVFAGFISSEGILHSIHVSAPAVGDRGASIERTTVDASALVSSSTQNTVGKHEELLQAYFLNLDHRQDRLLAIQQAWTSVRSISLVRIRATRHYTVTDSNGTSRRINGCTESMAYATLNYFADCPSCSVAFYLEDDAVPSQDFDEHFPAILEYANTHLDDWHIINLGTSIVYAALHPEDSDGRPNIYQFRSLQLLRSSVWSAAHALLINRNAVPILASMAHRARQHDLLDSHSCMDFLLSRDASVVTLVSVPTLVHQAPGVSDVPWGPTGAHRNMTAMFTEVDKALTEIMRRTSGATSTLIAFTSGIPEWRGSTITMPYMCDPAWSTHSVRQVMAANSLAEQSALAFGPITVYMVTDEQTQWSAAMQSWSVAKSVRLQPVPCSGYVPGPVLSTAGSPSDCLRQAIELGRIQEPDAHAGILAISDLYSVPFCGFDLAFMRLLMELQNGLDDWRVAVLGTEVNEQQARLHSCSDSRADSQQPDHCQQLWSKTAFVASSPVNATFVLINTRDLDDFGSWLASSGPTVDYRPVLISSPELTTQRALPGLSKNSLGSLVAGITTMLYRFSEMRGLHAASRSDSMHTAVRDIEQSAISLYERALHSNERWSEDSPSEPGHLHESSTLAPVSVHIITGHVLNLDHRGDRWTAMLAAWNRTTSVALQRRSARVHERRDEWTVNGCALSHYDATLESFASEPAADVILVMEDDATPSSDFDERFPAILEYALAHLGDWHIINLGTVTALASGYEPNLDDRPNLFQFRTAQLLRTSVWLSAHALLVNRKALPAYRRAMQVVLKHDRTDHSAQFEYVLSLDPRVVTLVAVPSLVVQAAGYSDNDLSQPDIAVFADHSHRFKDADKQLLEIMAFFSHVRSTSAKAYASLDPATPSVILPYFHPAWTSLSVNDVDAAVSRIEQVVQRTGRIQAIFVTPDSPLPPWKAVVHAWGDVRTLVKSRVLAPGHQHGAGVLLATLVRFLVGQPTGTVDLRASICNGNDIDDYRADIVILADVYAIPASEFEQLLAHLLDSLQQQARMDWAAVWLGPNSLSTDVARPPCDAELCSSQGSEVHQPPASALLLNRQLLCSSGLVGHHRQQLLYTTDPLTSSRPHWRSNN